MDKQSVQSEMSSYVGKLLRDHFGKGPSSVFVSLEAPYLTIYLKDFLAPMERVLVGQKNHNKVEETRDLMMRELIPDIKATFRASVGIEVESIYYDWSFPNKSGILIGIVKSDQQSPNLKSYDPGSTLYEEVEKVSEQAEKAPESINSYLLNDRTLLIVRSGILVAIEKELIDSGYEEPLKISKRRLEKRLLSRASFEKILGKPIEDTFVDWDFQNDRSYIVFLLRP
ncbi:Na-translocating system protein MpsC family protein [Halobacillus litoralis]|uniref:Na-translocating system protein MpsC family protein n=1 Tax=Halobacillus litoralis TaxID=45668 RepID=UPI0024921630|nr:Na-translocating system protein MpsC family protein [Halobacillus litoralis]